MRKIKITGEWDGMPIWREETLGEMLEREGLFTEKEIIEEQK